MQSKWVTQKKSVINNECPRSRWDTLLKEINKNEFLTNEFQSKRSRSVLPKIESRECFFLRLFLLAEGFEQIESYPILEFQEKYGGVKSSILYDPFDQDDVVTK